ncbi:NACHT, LRR and PYD domains-containing protein 3-like [Amblyraja radiata]|uniref:NACHT, LRR and PYD domains-containing protein 3-like n=1 Tax=Amblyraja radiata TaxID=386614 RepID=UPI00140301EA|nr:NACHT, LRR and PYD domains-containing protein 3-like [Amblyraja radiata]
MYFLRFEAKTVRNTPVDGSIEVDRGEAIGGHLNYWQSLIDVNGSEAIGGHLNYWQSGRGDSGPGGEDGRLSSIHPSIASKYDSGVEVFVLCDRVVFGRGPAECGAPPMSSMTELLDRCDDSQLLELTNHYRKRLEKAIQDARVIKRSKRGSRAAGSTLLLNLVTEKEPRVRNLIWKCFVKMHHLLPKLEELLKAMGEKGSDLIESFNNDMKASSELSAHLKDVQQKHMETLKAQTEILSVNTILMKEKVKVFQLLDRYAKLTVISTRLGPALHKCQELRLGRNDLGDSGVKLVSAALRNPGCKIQMLWLQRVGLTDSGAEDLASALSTNHTVTKLNLSENKLGDSGVKLVSAALRNPDCKIQTLLLNRVGLTDSGAEDLISALSTNHSLTQLYLGDNKLGDSGVKPVSAALRNPDCEIQILGLNSVGLTDSGAGDLTSALSTNHSLTKLWLGDNKLGDSGVKLVFAALTNPDCKIHRLGLDGVGLTDSGAEELVSALSTNTSLTELYLAQNSLTDQSVPALHRLILALPRLKWIRLGANKFSPTGKKELRSMQESRCRLRVVV